jgi:excisionase family DNA binding protein
MNLYSAKELAALAGVSASYIRKIIKEGKLPAKKKGRDWLISKRDGDRWLERFRNSQKES